MAVTRTVASLTIAGLLVLAGPGSASEVPRAADGHPDLSGVWDFSTLVPLERPGDLQDRALLTEEEAADFEARARAASGGVWSEPPGRFGDDRRTSLIVDPPDGKLPSLTEGAVQQTPDDDRETDDSVRIRVGGLGTAGPESRGLSERCLLGFNSGPPIVPGFYNQFLQVIQTEDYVVLHTEMIHEARIVPLRAPTGRADLRHWTGDSVGRWEGETLIVETSHFRSEVPSFTPTPFAGVGTAEGLRLVERLTRVDADTLLYEFTVDDEATYSRPFTVQLRMTRSEHPIYEYACHEGNYPLLHILQAARELERRASTEEPEPGS